MSDDDFEITPEQAYYLTGNQDLIGDFIEERGISVRAFYKKLATVPEWEPPPPPPPPEAEPCPPGTRQDTAALIQVLGHVRLPDRLRQVFDLCIRTA